MSAKGKADQAEVMALIRDFHKIERRMKGLDPADSAAIKEARQMKGELARTLQRRRGMLEATLERGYTTAADRRVGEEIARLLYSWNEEDLGPETAGGKPSPIGRSGCRPTPVPVLVPSSGLRESPRRRALRLLWVIVRLAWFAMAAHILWQFAH